MTAGAPLPLQDFWIYMTKSVYQQGVYYGCGNQSCFRLAYNKVYSGPEIPMIQIRFLPL